VVCLGGTVSKHSYRSKPLQELLAVWDGVERTPPLLLAKIYASPPGESTPTRGGSALQIARWLTSVATEGQIFKLVGKVAAISTKMRLRPFMAFDLDEMSACRTGGWNG
jgi:hypothetical protein